MQLPTKPVIFTFSVNFIKHIHGSYRSPLMFFQALFHPIFRHFLSTIVSWNLQSISDIFWVRHNIWFSCVRLKMKVKFPTSVNKTHMLECNTTVTVTVANIAININILFVCYSITILMQQHVTSVLIMKLQWWMKVGNFTFTFSHWDFCQWTQIWETSSSDK